MRSKRTAKRTTSPTPWRGWPTVCGLLVVLAAVVVFVNSFEGVFIFDEDRRIVNNERLRHLWPPWHLLRVHRPLVELSLAVNYALGKSRVWGYHTFNLVIHAAAGLTLFGIVRRTLLLGVQRARYGRVSHLIALAIALLWVIHPLQVQSVTYIIQRSESLMGMFYLLTLYCVIRGAGSTRPMWWYAAAVACSAAGMGSKAVMVTGPFAVILYDRSFLAGSFREAIRLRWKLYTGLAATWSVLFATGIAQGVFDASPRATAHVGFGYAGITPTEYLRSQPGVISHYLASSLWPAGLCLDYYWPIANTLGQVLLPLMIVGPLLIATMWALYKSPRVGFIGAWFFLILLPTSSFVPIKDVAFDHRMYLSLASVVSLAVLGMHGLMDYATRRGMCTARAARPISVMLFVAAAGALGYATVARNRTYRSELDMWSDVVAKRPNNPRAHENLGIAWERVGRLDKAEASLREAIRVQPDRASAYSNLGTIVSRLGRLDQAADLYRQALKIDPGYAFARVKLGEVLVRQGKIEAGISELRAAVRTWPRDPIARYALGNALSARRDFIRAIDEYSAAINLRPDYAEAHYSLGNALRDRGDLLAAVEQYREALRINPTLVSAHNNLGHVLLKLGHAAAAATQFREALRLDSRHPGARYGLADALARQGLAPPAGKH
ncbi:MAG: tetratricopeptide repeat protein [Phycisphaerae bacterium]